MHKDTLTARLVLTELTDGFKEGQAFGDIAHGAADFTQHEIDLILTNGDEILDLVGDVRDHLNSLAEVVSAPFLSPTRWNRSAPTLTESVLRAATPVKRS